jgi:hypothetical protein
MNLARHLRVKGSLEERAGESELRTETDPDLISGFLPSFLREQREPAPSDARDSRAEAQESARSMEKYGDLAVHIASLLAAAEDATEKVRQEAAQEAEQIRVVARREAAHIRHQARDVMRDSRRERSEAASYAGGVRAAADSYAEGKRLEAEAEAASIKVGAEYEARSIVADAERRVDEIEQAARGREEERERESRQVEERLKELLKTVRDLIQRLEERARPDERATVVGDDLPPSARKPAPTKAQRSGRLTQG